MKKRIASEMAIWDLHIHTNKCPKMTGELKRLTDDEYIDEIIEVLNNNPLVEMISFTDHNTFSLSVYEEFINRSSDVVLIPGVEVDFRYEESNKNYRQLVMYWDFDLNNKKNYEEFQVKAKLFNDFMKDNCYVVSLYQLFEWLDKNKMNAIFSPHAFKQEATKNKPGRGLDADINNEDKAERYPKLYSDQFFCFWESSGISSRAKAEKYLRDFDNEDSVSIISFSDSKNIEEFKKYVENIDEKEKYKKGPPQYFRSLPNFRGIQLVGVESERIILNDHQTTEEIIKKIKSKENGTYISKLIFDGIEINLSDKLNTIIGGRGEGKSILLDSIKIALSEQNSHEIEPQRAEFISKYKIKACSNGKELDSSFKFDYFSQSHVTKLFQSYGEEFDLKLQEYFEEDLPSKEKNSIEIYNNEIIEECRNSFETFSRINLDNIVSINTKIIKVTESQIRPIVLAKNKLKVDLIEDITVQKMYDDILKLIPKQIKNEPEVIDEIISFLHSIVKKIKQYNIEEINQKVLHNAFYDGIITAKKNSSDENKIKIEVGGLISELFKQEAQEIVERVNIIKNLLSVHQKLKLEKIIINDENKNMLESGETPLFLFTYQIEYESIYNYFERVLRDYINKKTIDNFSELGKKNLIEYYMYLVNEKDLLTGKTLDNLNKKLKLIELNISKKYVIYYRIHKDSTSVRYKDITKLSPGSQTNILMEYIVNKKVGRPLLIDQPEDNIDNQTIYQTLRKWFKELKYDRQIIVVTHDANIAINSDSENLIIAKQNTYDEVEKKPIFSYKYGALEYDENLDVASLILDGGKDAVKKRLNKYGEKEENNDEKSN